MRRVTETARQRPGLRPLDLETKRPIADYIYTEILEDLIDGRLEPGARLTIDGLSREMEVSPTPIREALTRLEATGLVIRVAQRGYHVAPLLTPSELIRLMDARLAIEPMNALLACERATDVLVEDLRRSVQALRAHRDDRTKSGGYWEADEGFHETIARWADNQFLYRAYTSLGGQAQRFRLFGDSAVTDADHAINEHEAIVAAIDAGDPAAARLAMEAHIQGVKSRALGDRVALEQ